MAMLSACEVCNVGCQSRNTCQRCNSCHSCNTSCNSPAGQCNTLQAFCSIGAQSAGGFSFNQGVNKDNLFLTKTNWNRLIQYINSAYAKGATSNGGSSGLPASDSNIFMTADMFNQVSKALGNLGSGGPSLRVVKDVNIVYGSYFSSLEAYANSLKLKTSQCDKCNVSCDATCDTCQYCNTSNCGSCNGSCQSHSPHSCSYCCSCNTCQTCDTCQTGNKT